jgi:hypothetical protein
LAAGGDHQAEECVLGHARGTRLWVTRSCARCGARKMGICQSSAYPGSAIRRQGWHRRIVDAGLEVGPVAIFYRRGVSCETRRPVWFRNDKWRRRLTPCARRRYLLHRSADW